MFPFAVFFCMMRARPTHRNRMNLIRPAKLFIPKAHTAVPRNQLNRP